MRTITHIVLHTAGARTKSVPPRPVYQDAAVIRHYHVADRGWADIGYHFVVKEDGTVEAGRPEERSGAHVDGFNGPTLGICVAGDGDLARWTPAQWNAAVELTARLLRKHGIDRAFVLNPKRVIGHREVNDLIKAGVTKAPPTSKTCPGLKVDMTAFRLAVLKVLD